MRRRPASRRWRRLRRRLGPEQRLFLVLVGMAIVGLASVAGLVSLRDRRPDASPQVLGERVERPSTTTGVTTTATTSIASESPAPTEHTPVPWPPIVRARPASNATIARRVRPRVLARTDPTTITTSLFPIADVAAAPLPPTTTTTTSVAPSTTTTAPLPPTTTTTMPTTTTTTTAPSPPTPTTTTTTTEPPSTTTTLDPGAPPPV